MQKLCVLIVVSTTALVLLARYTHARRLDCRKFVFAPRCRGVAAKRAGAALAGIDSTYLGPSNGQQTQPEAFQNYPTNEDAARKYPSYFTNSPQYSRQQAYDRPTQITLGELARISSRMRQPERGSDPRLEPMAGSSRMSRPTVQSTKDYLETILKHLEHPEKR